MGGLSTAPIAVLFLEYYLALKLPVRDLYKPYGVLMCRRISLISKISFKFQEEDLTCNRKHVTKEELPIRQSLDGPCVTAEGIRPDYKYHKAEKTGIYVNLYKDNKTWSEAQTVCEQEKATLLIMNTRAVRTIFSQQLVTMSMTAKDKVTTWVGLSRGNLTAPWTWSNGREANEKLHWSGYSFLFTYVPKFNCALGVTIFDRARFFEEQCAIHHFFICECPVN